MIVEILIKHHHYIYSKKPKRGGGGKFNVGTIQDELKEADVQKGEVVQEEIQEQEAPKDEGITLEEYYKLKDTGDHAVAINTEHADLLSI